MIAADKDMRKILSMAFAAMLALNFIACQDDSYIEDGGKHNPYYEGSIYEYLSAHPDKNYFTKLIDIIDYAGLTDVLKDSTVTFFAPTDWSIQSSVNALNHQLYTYMGQDSIHSLHQVKPEVWRAFLEEYIIRDKYTLKDIPQIDTTKIEAYPGQGYYSYGGKPMNVGVVYYDAAGVHYAGARQIIYSYVIDPQNHQFLNAYVATSDIQPRNGVLHVIRWIDHSFAFDKQRFVSAALTAGILKEE